VRLRFKDGAAMAAAALGESIFRMAGVAPFCTFEEGSVDMLVRFSSSQLVSAAGPKLTETDALFHLRLANAEENFLGLKEKRGQCA